MAFEGLSEKLSAVFKRLSGRGKLTEADIKTVMREVRLALLEADVSYKVVKDFVASVSARAVGADVLESLTPAQQVIKIVNEELCALMGGKCEKLEIAPKPPTVIMMVGLQGAGKTTNTAKLAAFYKKQGKKPLLAACDVYRPAAIAQLHTVGDQVGVPVFDEGQGDPVQIARNALRFAEKNGHDMLFLDTAGRLHIDEKLMSELTDIKAAAKPTEILLVLDSMTGQDAGNAASSFNEQLDITGVILTKLDGDTRGGAALSIRAVTGKPIKFTGVGEKLDAIEPFYPDRMASRILGMGDMLSLIEKAQASFDEKKALELEEKIRRNRLDLNDYLAQMEQMRSMGSMQDILGMLPGAAGKNLSGVQVDEKQLDRTQAIIRSMTKKERENPDLLNYSRKKRIAAGSGTKVEDINRLLKQFAMLQNLTKQMTNPKKAKRAFGGMKFPF
ncbi:MAG: signal recognition particle protein [Clostridia bacterium]|nr:signal recognition particle protein [Clostridia bacterium]